MTREAIGIIMNGVTGRMGYRQHLLRSVLAIRADGGVRLSDGSLVQVEPILVGRNPQRLAQIARDHQIDHWTTDLDSALSDSRWQVYGDFQVTSARPDAIGRALAAGRAVYTEKPTATGLDEALDLAARAEAAGVVNGVVHDKLYLPGLRKLARLVRGDVFGRILSVRGEFGYWVFEGDWQSAQRPSWNYRAADGGGIVADMFPHWNYLLENLFGPVEAVYTRAVTHLPRRTDEQGEPYPATADDAAYAVLELRGGIIAQINSSWAVRVNRKELVEFQVDGTHASAVAGLFGCRVQHRACTPKPVWNPDIAETHDYPGDWAEVPENDVFGNGFRAQWEDFLRHVAENRPYRYDLRAGARGVRLAEAGLESSRTGRRIELPGLDAATYAGPAAAGTDGPDDSNGQSVDPNGSSVDPNGDSQIPVVMR